MAPFHSARSLHGRATVLHVVAAIARTASSLHSVPLRHKAALDPRLLSGQRNNPLDTPGLQISEAVKIGRLYSAIVKWGRPRLPVLSKRQASDSAGPLPSYTPTFLEVFALQGNKFAIYTECEMIIERSAQPAPIASLKLFRFLCWQGFAFVGN